MKAKLQMLSTALTAVALTAGHAEEEGTDGVKFNAGADFRLRQEIMANLPGLPGDAYSQTPSVRAKSRNQLRMRPRVYFSAESGPFTLYARIADEFRIRNLSDHYDIVTDKSVSSADQFQSSFGFADSALSQNQNTFTVYIDQNAVHRQAGSKFHTQITYYFDHEGTGRTFG